MEVPQKITNRITVWFSNSTSGYLAKKQNNTLNQKDTCTPIFTAALMTIPKTWKQPKCPMWYVYLYTMEYYSAIKKEILPSAATQMDLDGIVSTQLCLTLCNPIDCSLPGFSIHGIFQARILEQVAISFSRGSSQPRDWTHVSYINCTGRGVLYH